MASGVEGGRSATMSWNNSETEEGGLSEEELYATTYAESRFSRGSLNARLVGPLWRLDRL